MKNRGNELYFVLVRLVNTFNSEYKSLYLSIANSLISGSSLNIRISSFAKEIAPIKNLTRSLYSFRSTFLSDNSSLRFACVASLSSLLVALLVNVEN